MNISCISLCPLYSSASPSIIHYQSKCTAVHLPGAADSHSKHPIDQEESRALPVENVEGNVDAGVADVAQVVGRDVADVHPDPAFDDWLEELLLRHQIEEHIRGGVVFSTMVGLEGGEDGTR